MDKSTQISLEAMIEQMTEEQRETIREIAQAPEDIRRHILIYGRALIDAQALTAKASA